MNQYGKESYVGRGTYNGQLAPGKLMIEPTKAYAAGLFFEFGLKEHLLTTGVEYYAKEPTCDYKWIPSANAHVVPNAVQFTSSSYTFYVGRAFLQGSTQVGKVMLEHRVMYFAFGGKGHATASYEVLVCEKITPVSTTPMSATMSKPVETSNDDLDELKNLYFKMKNELTTKNEEIQVLNNEIVLLREKLLEKVYLISELHTKLNECEG
jgi:Protein of unknown function (DUF3421)